MYRPGQHQALRLAADTDKPAVVIRLAPASRNVGVGDRFDMAIEIDALQQVSHLPITLVYDDQLLQVLDVWSGDFIGSKKESQFLAEYSEPGRIVIGASRLGNRPGVQGRGNLAFVRFRALAEGRSAIKFEKGKALDRKLAPLKPVRRKKTAIQIGPAGANPAPPGGGEPSTPPDLDDPPRLG